MLTAEERNQIDEEVSHYPTKRAACVEALKIVQKDRGWVSDESLKEVALYLDMTPDELDNVATFYNLIFRRPVGKHVILLCDSVSCWLMGYSDVRRKLIEQLGVDFGGTTGDGRFTLLPTVCLGDCDHAPAMMIDEDLYNSLKAENIEQILGQYKE